MPAVTPSVCNFTDPLPSFSLVDDTGAQITNHSAMGAKGLLVAFICNHCPYVRAILPRFVDDARDLLAIGIGVIAISSNDIENYPEDAPEKMRALATELDFPFPYVFDPTQSVAKAFDAVCTPDFFGYNREGIIQYRGRFDASRLDPAPLGAARDLRLAMEQIANTGAGPEQQYPSIGCSIKWRRA